jgi:hypothetical protein
VDGLIRAVRALCRTTQGCLEPFNQQKVKKETKSERSLLSSLPSVQKEARQRITSV